MQGSLLRNTQPGPLRRRVPPRGGPSVPRPGLRRARPPRGARPHGPGDREAQLNARGHGRAIVWVRPHETGSDAHLPRRPSHGRVPVDAGGPDDRGHRARHRRARDLSGERARKQIGTRRALGARRADIVRYFLVENALLGGGGVLSRCAARLRGARLADQRVPMPPLPSGYVLASAVGLPGPRPARGAVAGTPGRRDRARVATPNRVASRGATLPAHAGCPAPGDAASPRPELRG